MIKPTCNLNQDTALIKSQYICCRARVCLVSAVMVIYILNTQKPAMGLNSTSYVCPDIRRRWVCFC